MALMISLEDFDAKPQPALEDPMALPEELPGYEAGFAAGMQHAQAAQQQIDAALVQTLGDMGFGFAEARQNILQGLAPLFQALVDQVLPQIIDQSFHAQLTEALIGLAEERSRAPVRLIVHPDQVEAVSALLPAISGLDIDLHQDPEVGAHGALISQGARESLLDLDELISEIRTILSALFDQTDLSQEQLQNG